MAPTPGIEPGTNELTARRSAAELSWNNPLFINPLIGQGY